MPYQTGANILVAIRAETTMGVAATVTGAAQVRIIASPGLDLKRAVVQSVEKRADMQIPLGRLGNKSVDGSYNAELSVGGAHDVLMAALLRTAYVTSTGVPFLSMTTVALGSNTVTAGSGSWFTAGIRVGDLFTITGTTIPVDNSTNVRVISMTTLTLVTTPGAFTTLVATATGTIAVLKKASVPAAPTRMSFTVEEYSTDIDLTELFLGCRLVGVKYSFKPGAMAQVTYTFLGLDHTLLVNGTSPYFTTPAVSTGLALLADDSVIIDNGTVVGTFTGFDLEFKITAKGEPVIGSLTGVDIFDNDLMVTGSITGLRTDFTYATRFDAETEYAISILLQEPIGTPRSALGLYLGRVKLATVVSPLGGDGAVIESKTLLVGPPVANAAAGIDGSVVTVHSTAP